MTYCGVVAASTLIRIKFGQFWQNKNELTLIRISMTKYSQMSNNQCVSWVCAGLFYVPCRCAFVLLTRESRACSPFRIMHFRYVFFHVMRLILTWICLQNQPTTRTVVCKGFISQQTTGYSCYDCHIATRCPNELLDK